MYGEVDCVDGVVEGGEVCILVFFVIVWYFFVDFFVVVLIDFVVDFFIIGEIGWVVVVVVDGFICFCGGVGFGVGV